MTRIVHLLTLSILLGVSLLPKCSFVRAQDMIALSEYDEDKPASFASDTGSAPTRSTQYIYFDATNLGTGNDFYDRPSIQLQLKSDSNVKTFNRMVGSSARNESFMGESEGGDSLQLLRYKSPTTGRELLVGSLVELDTKLVYQFRQPHSPSIERDSLGEEKEIIVVQAAVTPSGDFPESAEPYQFDATAQAQIEQYHVAADQTYLAQVQAAAPTDTTIDKEPTHTSNDDASIDIVTLMVVWTKQAECQYSNLTKNCDVTQETEDNMRALIAAGVAETNVAYEMSEINIRHELVHAYRHPDYDEDVAYEEDPLGIGNFAISLVTMIIPIDGILDDVPQNRREYEADMVSLIINDQSYCGAASIGTGIFPVPTAPFMYSVLYWGCFTGIYVLGHELGHNFGCFHDRGTGGDCDWWSFFYAHGWRNPDAQFRSIMAYPCRPNQCDNNPGTECPVIPRFSSTTATYNGLPLGDYRNDCSKQIRRTGPQISKFYGGNDRVICRPNGILCNLYQFGVALGGYLCFAPHMTVQMEGQELPTEMKDLRIGDRVLTVGSNGDPSYETIYSINHYDRTKPTEFVQLHVQLGETSNNTVLLELSAFHMVFVHGRSNPVPASQIQVGDLVHVLPFSPEQSNKTRSSVVVADSVASSLSNPRVPSVYRHAQVLDVKTVVRSGFYNPLTTSGTIAVNGVVASTYASLQAVLRKKSPHILGSDYLNLDDAFIKIGRWSIISHHTFLHWMLSPFRAFSLARISMTRDAKPWDTFAEEPEDEEYLSPYCYWGVVATVWWQKQRPLVQVLGFLGLLLVFGVLNFLALAFATLWAKTWLIVCSIGLIRSVSRPSRTQLNYGTNDPAVK